MNDTFIERLNFLRKHTILGPIALMKLGKLKRDIRNAIDIYYKYEGELLDFDFDSYDQYEYDLRFRYWSYDCANLWMNHADGLGLDDFALRVMDDLIAKEKLLSKKKTKKYKK